MTSKNRNRMGSKKKLTLESLESRHLLATLTPGVSFVSTDADDISSNVRLAFEQVSDLSQYTDTQLNNSDWVVRLNDGHSPVEITSALKLATWQLEEAPLISRTYVIANSAGNTAVIDTLQDSSAVEYFYPLVRETQEKKLVPNDPLFEDQWHLDNTGQLGSTAGEDINILNAWNNFTGDGVVIGVVDDGVDGDHPDLEYRADLSFDYGDGDRDASPADPLNDTHGTAVAGVAAATGDNEIGVVGSGFGAEVAGIRLLVPTGFTDVQEGDALSHESNQIDIYNNSWGPTDGFAWYSAPGPFAAAALDDTAIDGRGGLGNIHVWAAGNGLQANDNANYDGYANSLNTLAVTSVNGDGEQSFYAEPGANILVAAPSNEPGIVTIDNVGNDGATPFTGIPGSIIDDNDPSNYRTDFGGTSSATPVVSGVIALMLEANPQLSYRDIQHILVNTSRMNDTSDGDWTVNGAGHDINHKYGFGVIDAEVAVQTAITWPTSGPELILSTDLFDVDQDIPDNDLVGTQYGIAIPAVLDDGSDLNNFSIEHVMLDFETDHTFRGDLDIRLTSPDGTVSVLATQHDGDFGALTWRFNSVRHWGESPVGLWTVTVSDQSAFDIGMIEQSRLIFSGTGTAGTDVPIVITPPTDNGVISGTVFNDADGDGIQDAGEDRLAGQTVFIDSNNNGLFDSDEPTAISGTNGSYFFTGLPIGSYNVGYICNVEPGNAVNQADSMQTVFVGLSGISSGNDFAGSDDCLPIDEIDQVQDTAIEGVIFADTDGDGVQDLDEPGIPDQVVYADLNNNCVIGLGEPSGTSDANGRYSLAVESGDHFIRMVPHPGSQLLACQGTVVSAPGDVRITHNIGFAGDNEFDYSTDGTAEHGIFPGFHLGAIVSSDPTVDDNDGVIFSSGLVAGQTEQVVVVADKIAVSTAYLQGWIDWNGDGNFGNGEQVFRNVQLNQGINNLSINVPSSAQTSAAKALFRYGFERNIGPTEAAIGGEAESYILDIPPGGQTGVNAVDDTATVPAGGSVTIDVLDNDSAGLLGDGTLTITSVSSPDAVIDGNTITYTPGEGAAAVESFTYTIEDSRGGTDTATVTVNVQFELPLARPETAEAIAGTGNTIDVVANDFSTAGEGTGVTITNVQGSTNATVTISDDNQIIYTPDSSFEGIDTFTYTITDDQNGQTSTTTVTVNVESSGPLVEIELQVTDAAGNEINGPITVGQEFFLVGIVRDLREAEAEGVFSAFLDVVLSNSSLVTIGEIMHDEYPNDSSGTVVGNQIDEVGGVAEVDDNGNVNDTAMQLFSVSMTAVAEGTLDFLGNPADLEANDTTLLGLDVEVSGNLINFINDSIVINDLSGDRVNYEIRVTDLAGNSIESVGVNQDFQVEIYVQDLTNRAQSGVFAGYLDVNFDPSRVQLNGAIVHGADYLNGTSGITATPGLIDELGGFDGLSPLGSDPVLLATIPLTAISAGQVEFTGDPADDEAQHATLLFGENAAVNEIDLRFSADTLNISGEAANGALTNSSNPLDVTGDGRVTPIDALAVVNDLNKNGARSLGNLRQSSAAPMIDVNGDGNATALDALMVINYLNRPQTDARAALSASASQPVALPNVDVWSTWSDLDSDDESDEEWLEDVTAAIQGNSDVS